jgi:hypothetical protein
VGRTWWETASAGVRTWDLWVMVHAETMFAELVAPIQALKVFSLVDSVSIARPFPHFLVTP